MDTDAAPPTALKDAWHDLLREEREALGPKPTADGTLFRASSALSCHRQRVLAATEVDKTEDVSDDSLRAFRRGTETHEELQRVITDKWGGQVEVMASYKDQGIELSGSADGAFYDLGEPYNARVLAEIKTTKRFGFYLMTHGAGDPRWAPQAPTGPKPEYVTQAALYALSPQIGAEYVHIIAVCKDDDQIAEWFYHLDDKIESCGGHTPRELAERDLATVKELTALVADGTLPGRFIPGHGTVDDPPKHHAARGKPWNCRFCDWNSLCRALPAGRVPLSEVSR